MLKTARKWVAIILSIAVISMATLSILSIWGIYDDDLAWKALGTLGVIFVASIVSLVIIKVIEEGNATHPGQTQK
jgi:hypothetical protein